MPTLGQSERARIDDAVGPGEATRLQFVDEVTHSVTSIEVEHEGDVFQQKPSGPAPFHRVDQPKYMTHKSGVPPGDPGRSARLAEVLTWEASGDEVHAPNSLEFAYIVCYRNAWKSCLKHATRASVDLTQERGFVSGPMQTEFDTADTGE